MIDSKQLKDEPSAKSRLKEWWLNNDFVTAMHEFHWKWIGKPCSQVKKMAGWYWNVFRYDYDFDGHSLFAIMEYKLIRVQHALNNGYAIHEKKDLKALKLAIKLAGRLKDDKYEQVAHRRHSEKWGDMIHWMTPRQEDTSFYFHSMRPNAIFADDKVQERKEFMELYLAAQAKSDREERWFYDTLRVYLRRWWD